MQHATCDNCGNPYVECKAASAEIARLRAEVERLNGILDAERDMQAKLVSEGTRLSADLAAARAELAKALEDAATYVYRLDWSVDPTAKLAQVWHYLYARAAEAKEAT